jgi:hypothetical protein
MGERSNFFAPPDQLLQLNALSRRLFLLTQQQRTCTALRVGTCTSVLLHLHYYCSRTQQQQQKLHSTYTRRCNVEQHLV